MHCSTYQIYAVCEARTDSEFDPVGEKVVIEVSCHSYRALPNKTV